MKITNYELRIKNLLLGLWLLLIPTQLGKHWWPEWSLVNGIRIDYLSPTLYLVDVVWGLWVITNCELKIKSFKNKRWWIGLGLVVMNVLTSTNKWAAIYKAGRWVQLIVTVILIRGSKIKIQNYLKWIIPIWVVAESWLGWAQITSGRSLQGVWWWLGERRFSYLTIGVANWEVLGRGLIRAYGTFSHPNSLAGFLLVSMFWWTKLLKSKKNMLYWLVVWMGVLGIIISGSRTAWMVMIIYNLKFLIFNKKRLAGAGLILAGVVIMILAGINENYRVSDFVGGWDRDGWNKRANLGWSAVKMWQDSPLLGVGLNNFLVRLPGYQNGGSYWLQPVHNIFLLMLVEVGIVGMLGLIYNFKFFIPNSRNRWMWVAILTTGMMDHYWLTLPQNMWLLALVIGL